MWEKKRAQMWEKKRAETSKRVEIDTWSNCLIESRNRALTKNPRLIESRNRALTKNPRLIESRNRVMKRVNFIKQAWFGVTRHFGTKETPVTNNESVRGGNNSKELSCKYTREVKKSLNKGTMLMERALQSHMVEDDDEEVFGAEIPYLRSDKHGIFLINPKASVFELLFIDFECMTGVKQWFLY
ncbi:hypothetical protein OSB04_017774 [Centaurea solstitialis]|uniref:Uncharacterized protein n=1 Tax=Centaurea solstitialis TaxID=347529 RepID=A0AA38WL22_9ASTR|nr:hypothetical protein OSB04_017774 [Centaurea solstitialis]